MTTIDSSVPDAADPHATPRSLAIANAGSGKTFTLANRILRWSVDELRAGRVPEPARILAVTFTRKAAGEILARVLAHAAAGAASGADGDKARDEFASVVGNATREEYLAALVALCGELHRMQVGTIDGYFHRIASALPEEVGLPPEWTVGDDREIEELRAEVALQVLAGDEAVGLLDLLEEGAPKPSVTSAVTKLLGGSSVTPLDIYRATLAGGDASIDRAWNWARRLLESDLGSGAAVRDEKECSELVARFTALQVPTGKKGKPDGNWSKAHGKCAAELARGDWRAVAANGFFARMAEGGTYRTHSVPDDFHEVASLLVPHLRGALLTDLARRMSGAREVLASAHAALESAQRHAGIYTFSDIGRGVARAAQRPGSRVADPDALRESLGADIRDLAIDEAQDTSVEQFLALRPIIEDVLARGRFLLVGDPKQSIYGWRGGTPGLIAHIEHEYADSLGTGVTLTKSYRSSPLVMDFVNRLFARLEDDLLALVPREEREERIQLAEWTAEHGLPEEVTVDAFRRAARAWRMAHHESARHELGGRIAMYACGASEDDGDADAAGEDPPDVLDGLDDGDAHAEGVPADTALTPAACAAAIAARLHREEPRRSIGILMRTNKEVADTIAELRALGVRASDEGRATLLDAPAVLAVVAMLRLVDDPGDRISHFLASRGPMAAFTGLAPLEDHERSDDAHAAAERFAVRTRGRIADHGIAAVVRDAIDAMAVGGGVLAPRDAERLARVLAIADDLSGRPLARTLDLLDAIEADKADASSAERIRVMTVHKSKGLEFDEVVLGSLEGTWGKAPTGWAMLAISPTEPPAMVASLGTKEIRGWIPHLQLLERDGRRRGVLDDISSLYVAITRAKFGLHLVMSAKEKGQLPSAAKFIRRALRVEEDGGTQARPNDTMAGAPDVAKAFAAARPDASTPFWSHAYGSLPSPKSAELAAESDIGDDAPLLEVVDLSAGSAMPPSAHAPASLWQFDPFFGSDTALRGVLVHECFRHVRDAADIDQPEKRARVVASAAERAAIEKGEPIGTDLVAEVESLLARVAVGSTGAALGAAFRIGTERTVRTELPFVRETADGLVHGRIDRLELALLDGRVVGARIIDFKTGAVGADAEGLARKCVGYFEQLSGYRDAVSEMYGLDASAIELLLLFVDRDEVIAGE